MSHIGAGYNGHCLSGELAIIFETSDEVTDLKTSRADVERCSIATGDEFRVASRMLSIYIYPATPPLTGCASQETQLKAK